MPITENGCAISTTNGLGYGISVNNAQATLSGGSITTMGTSAHGMQSLQARLGVRIAKDAKGPEEATGGGVRLSVWHEFESDPKTEVSSANGYLPFNSDTGGSWWEIKAGVTSKIRRNAYLYAISVISARSMAMHTRGTARSA